MSVRKLVASIASTVALGATLVAAPPASATSNTANDAQATCPSQRLCIFDGFSHTGNQRNFYYCRFENIGADIGWSDRLRSFINNQTPGTVTKFYNWDGQRWVLLGTSTAPESVPIVNFALRTTDAIQVC